MLSRRAAHECRDGGSAEFDVSLYLPPPGCTDRARAFGRGVACGRGADQADTWSRREDDLPVDPKSCRRERERVMRRRRRRDLHMRAFGLWIGGALRRWWRDDLRR